jgi:hypothetical protein
MSDYADGYSDHEGDPLDAFAHHDDDYSNAATDEDDDDASSTSSRISADSIIRRDAARRRQTPADARRDTFLRDTLAGARNEAPLPGSQRDLTAKENALCGKLQSYANVVLRGHAAYDAATAAESRGADEDRVAYGMRLYGGPGLPTNPELDALRTRYHAFMARLYEAYNALYSAPPIAAATRRRRTQRSKKGRGPRVPTPRTADPAAPAQPGAPAIKARRRTDADATAPAGRNVDDDDDDDEDVDDDDDACSPYGDEY